MLDINKGFGMDKQSFADMMKDINELHKKSLDQPTKIKINEKWLKTQEDSQQITFQKPDPSRVGYYGTFTGVPYEIDNTVDTFKLIYREEESEK